LRLLRSRYFSLCHFVTFSLFESSWYLITDHLFHFFQGESLYICHLCDLLPTTLEIGILFAKLDKWSIAAILDGDLFFTPVMDIAIGFFIDLGSDEDLSISI
jgi:hypothetical protein